MKYQILAVDDDLVNQKIIGLLLKALGMEYTIARGGKEALQVFKRETPDLILMDLMMPGMDGYHTALEIRRLEFGKGRLTPIIACTALDYQYVRERCIAATINDCISKPISRELLAHKLELWMQQALKSKPLKAKPVMDKELANRIRWTNVLDDGPIDRKYLKLVYGLDQLDEIFALFLTVAEDLLRDIRNAIEAKDISAVNSLSHELKASSYAVGARQLADRCLDLERAGQIQEWSSILQCNSAVQASFEQLHLFLQKTYDEYFVGSPRAGAV